MSQNPNSLGLHPVSSTWAWKKKKKGILTPSFIPELEQMAQGMVDGIYDPRAGGWGGRVQEPAGQRMGDQGGDPYDDYDGGFGGGGQQQQQQQEQQLSLAERQERARRQRRHGSLMAEEALRERAMHGLGRF